MKGDLTHSAESQILLQFISGKITITKINLTGLCGFSIPQTSESPKLCIRISECIRICDVFDYKTYSMKCPIIFGIN